MLPTRVRSPEYGSLAWAIAACLRLCAPRVLQAMDQRKAVLSSMVRARAFAHACVGLRTCVASIMRVCGRRVAGWWCACVHNSLRLLLQCMHACAARCVWRVRR